MALGTLLLIDKVKAGNADDVKKGLTDDSRGRVVDFSQTSFQAAEEGEKTVRIWLEREKKTPKHDMRRC